MRIGFTNRALYRSARLLPAAAAFALAGFVHRAAAQQVDQGAEDLLAPAAQVPLDAAAQWQIRLQRRREHVQELLAVAN